MGLDGYRCFNQYLAPPGIGCLGYSTRKNHLRATSSGRDEGITVMHFGACVLGFEGKAYQGTYSCACNGW